MLQKTYPYRSFIDDVRRRPFLATLGASVAGSVSGCLGGLDDNDPPPETGAPFDGRYQWGYDAHNSRYTAGITGPTDKPELQRLYRSAGGPPLTANGRLFTQTWSAAVGGDVRWVVGEPWQASRIQALYEDNVLGIGTPYEGFWAASMEDGTEQWHVEISLGVVLNIPIKVFEDRAFITASTGIECVDLAEQDRVWAADLDAVLPYHLQSTKWHTPAITESHVFVLNEYPANERDWEEHPRVLYALDRETGELDWTADLELGEPGYGFSDPIVDDRYVLLTGWINDNPEADADDDRWTHVVAVDPRAGEVAWSKTLEGSSGIDPFPAVAHGHLYTRHGSLRDERQPLLSALDTTDGSVKWSVKTDTISTVPTVTDDLIYVWDGGRLRGLDPETGEDRWATVDGHLYEQPEVPDPSADFRWTGQFIPVVHDGRLFTHIGEDRLLGFW